MSGPGAGLVTLDNGQLRALVQPDLGAGLTQLAVHDGGDWQHLLRPRQGRASEPRQMACCLLMPWSNRLYEAGFRWRGRAVSVPPAHPGEQLPLHGDAWLAPWRVTASTPTEIVLAHETAAGAVFAYTAQVRYRLAGMQLRVHMSVTHVGSTPLPYGLGLHPWFVRDANTELAFSSTGRWEPDATQPPGEFRPLPDAQVPGFSPARALPLEPIDHVYAGWDGAAEIRWPSRGLAVRLQADPAARHLVVYSPSSAGGHPDFVCIEPVTHCNDAHRAPDPLAQGLVELHQGEKCALEVTLTALAN